MANIWHTMWLCPRKHMAFGILWNADKNTAADMEAMGENVFTGKGGPLNRKCGICEEGLAPESGATPFTSMAEATIAGAFLNALQDITARELAKLREQNRN